MRNIVVGIRFVYKVAAYAVSGARIFVAVLALVLLAGCGWNPFGPKEDYLRRGVAFASKGDYAAAELQYQKALQKDDKYGEAYLRYGQLLDREKKTSEAIYCFSRAAELLPQSAEAKTELGRTALTALLQDRQRPEGLRRVVDKNADELLAAKPDSFEGLRLKGYLGVIDSHPAQAIEYFTRALQVRPNVPEIVTVLTQTLLYDNQGPAAEKLARDSLRTIKSHGPLYDILYGYYISTNRPADGEQLLRTKIDNNPGVALYVIELADHFWRQKNVPEMERVIKGLTADTARYPDALLLAGDFYRRIGKGDAAIEFYRKGLESGSKKQYLQRIVTERLAEGNLEEASAAVEAELRAFPDDAEALASQASLRMASGKPDEMKKAVTELVSLLKKSPANDGIRISLARAYRDLGQEENARNTLKDILQRDPGNTAALREIADIAIRSQRPDEALRYADRLLEVDPHNIGARLVRTSAWALSGRFGEVRAELRRLIAENPDLPEPWLQMATLDVQDKNYAEAEQIFRRLYKPGAPDIRPAKGLAMLYLGQGQPQKALALAQDEARRTGRIEARSLLVSTAAQAGDLDLALTAARKLSADFPDRSEYLISVGGLSEQKGNLEEAIGSFQKAQQAAPGDPIPAAYLAEALAKAGRHSEAVAVSRQSLKLDPNDLFLVNNLAWHLAEAGTNLEEADGLARMAVQREPGNTAFADTLGVVSLKAGKPDNAMHVFQGLVRREPGNSTFHLHFAEALIAKGDQQKARTELETALRSRPQADEEVTIRKLLAGLS